MKTGIKKITINAVEKAMKENVNNSTTVDFYGNELNIIHTLPFDSMVSFVNGAVASCINSETAKYMSEVKDFVIKVNTVAFYTNISMPDNIQKKYKFVYDIWELIYPIIVENINQEQYCSMVDSINEKLENIVNTNASVIVGRVSELSNRVEDLMSSIKDIFQGVSNEDIKSMANTFAENGGIIDETKIADAVLKRIS